MVSICQNFVNTRVVHLPKRTETSLITESDQSGPNHQLLQLCTVRTDWSESDQAVRAVHSCNSWFVNIFDHTAPSQLVMYRLQGVKKVRRHYLNIHLKVNNFIMVKAKC